LRVARSRHSGLELPFEHFLEEVAPPAHTPQLELGVVTGVEPEHNEVGADLGVDVDDDATTPAVEAVGEAKDRGKFAESITRALVERRRARFGGLDVAAPVMAYERGKELDLVGGSRGSCA
jgi:hypothetical protein